MIRYENIYSLVLLLFFIKSSIGDVFSDVMRSQDPCKDVCNGILLSAYSTKHARQTCQRGCRFFNIEKRNGLPAYTAKKKCHASCSESYATHDQLHVCIAGCDKAMKHQQQFDDIDFWMIYLGQDENERDNLILPQLDLDLDGDLFLTDPVFRNQLEWNYGVEYKIPETHIRTMPVATTNNKSVLPKIVHANETKVVNNSMINDWFGCLSRDSDLPKWLLASSLCAAILVALWIWLAPERRPTLEVVQPFFSNGVHFAPPPKYSLIAEKV